MEEEEASKLLAEDCFRAFGNCPVQRRWIPGDLLCPTNVDKTLFAKVWKFIDEDFVSSSGAPTSLFVLRVGDHSIVRSQPGKDGTFWCWIGQGNVPDPLNLEQDLMNEESLRLTEEAMNQLAEFRSSMSMEERFPMDYSNNGNHHDTTSDDVIGAGETEEPSIRGDEFEIWVKEILESTMGYVFVKNDKVGKLVEVNALMYDFPTLKAPWIEIALNFETCEVGLNVIGLEVPLHEFGLKSKIEAKSDLQAILDALRTFTVCTGDRGRHPNLSSRRKETSWHIRKESLSRHLRSSVRRSVVGLLLNNTGEEATAWVEEWPELWPDRHNHADTEAVSAAAKAAEKAKRAADEAEAAIRALEDSNIAKNNTNCSPASVDGQLLVPQDSSSSGFPSHNASSRSSGILIVRSIGCQVLLNQGQSVCIRCKEMEHYLNHAERNSTVHDSNPKIKTKHTNMTPAELIKRTAYLTKRVRRLTHVNAELRERLNAAPGVEESETTSPTHATSPNTNSNLAENHVDISPEPIGIGSNPGMVHHDTSPRNTAVVLDDTAGSPQSSVHRVQIVTYQKGSSQGSASSSVLPPPSETDVSTPLSRSSSNPRGTIRSAEAAMNNSSSRKKRKTSPTYPMELEDLEREMERQNSSNKTIKAIVSYDKCQGYIYDVRHAGHREVHHNTSHAVMLNNLINFLKRNKLTNWSPPKEGDSA